MSKTIIASLLALMLGVSVFAGNMQRHEVSDELANYVEMTDSQRAQVHALRNSLHTQKRELKELSKEDRYAAKKKLKEQYRADLERILSAEQMTKYDEHRHMHKGSKRKHKEKTEKAKSEIM